MELVVWLRIAKDDIFYQESVAVDCREPSMAIEP